jgi:hypothetical protein
MKSSTWSVLAASALFSLAGWLGVSTAAEPPQGDKTAKAGDQPEQPKQDVVIFRNGNVLYGKVVSETATSIHFKGKIAGIDAETDYPKADILEVKKAGGDAAAAKPEPVKDTKPVPVAPPPVSDENTTGKTNIYWVDLDGEFGEDISQTPIRNAMKDARKCKANVVIFKLNADFKEKDGIVDKDRPNDMASFDQLFRCEAIMPIFVTEMPTEWGGEMPRIVFWVKQAMAGAAFLPLISKEIYFTSDSRLGGIGNLAQIFEGVGDDVVREKQRSLRLGHAEGWAITGGYDPRLIRAMARIEYVLSVRYENGMPVLFEGYPSNPGEELLTDDGKDERADTLSERARGEGNDVLTLDARKARLVGVSKGTVDTQAELITAMGLDRTGVLVPGRAKQIMTDWSKGLDSAKHQIRRIVDDYRAVRVDPPGGYDQRTKARGQRLRKLEDLKGLIVRWGEGLQRFLGQNGIPNISEIDTIEEQIRLEQLKDHR